MSPLGSLFDWSISVGNILTVTIVVIGGIVTFVRLQERNKSTDARLDQYHADMKKVIEDAFAPLEKRVAALEKEQSKISEIQQDLVRVETKIDFLLQERFHRDQDRKDSHQ